MKVIGSRKRGLIEYSGEKKTLVIRRLRCHGCGRIHHELPDLMVPYKRYSCESVERILSSSKTEPEAFPCELSTAIRLKLWFFLLREYFKSVLISLLFHFDEDKELCSSISCLIPCLDFKPPFTGWLKKLVRQIVNSGRWRHTRSA